MRNMENAAAPQKIEPARGNAKHTDFTTLPGYDDLRLQRSIGEKLGLAKSVFPHA